MNVTRNALGELESKDPVVGLAILSNTTQEELRSNMNTIIRMGNDHDSIHTIYFEDQAIGLILIEPNSCSFSESASAMMKSSMANAIDYLIEYSHGIGSCVLIWNGTDIGTEFCDPERPLTYELSNNNFKRSVKIFDDTAKENVIITVPFAEM